MFLITQWGQQPNSNHQNQKIKYKHSVKKLLKSRVVELEKVQHELDKIVGLEKVQHELDKIVELEKGT